MEELLEQRQQETEDERRELLAMLDDLDRTVRSSTFQAACMEAERAGFVKNKKLWLLYKFLSLLVCLCVLCIRCSARESDAV